MTDSSRYQGTRVAIAGASEPILMSDEQFLTELKACRLPVSDFHHVAHVRLGYLCLRRHGYPEALVTVRTLIQDYAKSIGKDSLYDETVTVAFLMLIQKHLRTRGDPGGWEAFRDQNPELLCKDALQSGR